MSSLRKNHVQSIAPIDLTSLITEEILKAITELRFGSIEIIIHDGKIVQIDRKEKIRFQ